MATGYTLNITQPKPVKVNVNYKENGLTIKPSLTTTYKLLSDSNFINYSGVTENKLNTIENNYITSGDTIQNSTKWNGYNNWVGTQVDYDLLTPDTNTLYFITE